MHVVLWEFHVRPGREADFERAYGPDGDWVRLLRQAPGYLGTELWRDHRRPRVYLNVDRWKSVTHRNRFRSGHAAAYERLDAACQAFTDDEIHIGDYTWEEFPPQPVAPLAASPVAAPVG